MQKGYPFLMWDAETGELVTVNSPEDNREGLLPYHPSDTVKAEAAKRASAPWGEQPPPPPSQGDNGGAGNGAGGDQLPMTRDEIKVALDRGNVQYAGNASTVSLYNLLCTSLRGFLESSGNGNVPADADAPTMLAMLKGSN